MTETGAVCDWDLSSHDLRPAKVHRSLPVDDWLGHVSASGRRLTTYKPPERDDREDGLHKVRVWDLAGERRRLAPTHVVAACPVGYSVEKVSISEDGRRLLTASSDKRVRVWELGANGRVRRSLELSHGEYPAWRLSFTPDGQRVICVARYGPTDRFGTAFVWDLDVARLVSTARTHAGRELTASEREKFVVGPNPTAR